MSCANGAEPTPEFAQAAIAIQIAAVGATVLEFISAAWPAAAATAVLAQIPVTRLCDMNLTDPGDWKMEYLWSDQSSSGIPSFQSATGTFGWWIMQRCLYDAFVANCRCKDAAPIPPPAVVHLPPPANWHYPPGEDNQPILRRIEDRQTVSGDALMSLYHGEQYTKGVLNDLYTKGVPNTYQRNEYIPWTMEGEGVHQLPDVDLAYGVRAPDTMAIEVVLTNIPATVKRQGTLVPRLYGIGSIYWAGDYRDTDPQLIAGRHALHFERELIAVPRHVVVPRVYWRLMPGVTADAWRINWNANAAFAQPWSPYATAMTPNTDFGALPPHWDDPPFYVNGAPQRRVWALKPG